MIAESTAKGNAGTSTSAGERISDAKQFCHMKAKSEKIPHKLCANPKEPAVKARKRDPNFKPSRDICEDRGERQIKTGGTGRRARP
jgi:hypothetical protein